MITTATADRVPALEGNPLPVELSRRRQSLETPYERSQIASAVLNCLQRLNPAWILFTLEPPHC